MKTLFKGLKVFLNREVPREPLCFTLRCFGAKVSWDRSLFIGATFDETDETITHQIVDRPDMEKQYISRLEVLCICSVCTLRYICLGILITNFDVNNECINML